jgi:lipopolysaccharide export system permease protein
VGGLAEVRKILDRYVLGIFVPAVFLFTVTLLFLFIAVDFASKLGKFLEIKFLDPNQTLVMFIVKYYLYRLPMLLIILIPSVLLFAPTFTVIKLARANELLPIATSGISLRRMALPFLTAALLGGLTMAAMEEFVLPPIGDKIAETDTVQRQKNVSYNVEDWDGHTKLWAFMYTPSGQLLSREVRITRLDDAMEPIEIITAKRAQWNPRIRKWVAFEGSVEQPKVLIYPPGEKPRTKVDPIPPEGYPVDSKLSPETLRKDLGSGNRHSYSPLKAQIDEMRRYPHVPSVVIRVHARFSFPLSPIVLLLVGLPFVMDPHSKSFVKGLIFCFLLAVGYYVTHFACIDLGNRGWMTPVVAAWFPITSFGAVGIVCFARMRT